MKAYLTVVKILTFFTMVCSTGVFVDYLWVVAVPLAIVGLLDIKSRISEFNRIKNMRTLDKRLLLTLSKSPCQRNVAIGAGYLNGQGTEVLLFYRNLGYRWYNILPDYLAENPLNFFTHRFWRTFFR